MDPKSLPVHHLHEEPSDSNGASPEGFNTLSMDDDLSDQHIQGAHLEERPGKGRDQENEQVGSHQAVSVSYRLPVCAVASLVRSGARVSFLDLGL